MQKQLDLVKDDIELLRAQTEQHLVDSPSTRRMSPPQPEPFSAGLTQNAKVWVMDVECYFRLAGIDDDTDRLMFVQLLLRGRVKWWWHQQLEIPNATTTTTWNAFKESLVEQFTDPNAIERAERRLENLSQSHSIVDFVSTFREIAFEIPDLKEREKIKYFVRGLKEELAKEVLRSRPSTLENAIKVAEDMH